jgi:hypothetical protein
VDKFVDKDFFDYFVIMTDGGRKVPFDFGLKILPAGFCDGSHFVVVMAFFSKVGVQEDVLDVPMVKSHTSLPNGG